MVPTRDWIGDRWNAERLAGRIRVYWRRRGFEPKVWCEPFEHGTEVLWRVVSDLVNGLPREQEG